MASFQAYTLNIPNMFRVMHLIAYYDLYDVHLDGYVPNVHDHGITNWPKLGVAAGFSAYW